MSKKRVYEDEWEWKAKKVHKNYEKIQKTNPIKYTPKRAMSCVNMKPRKLQNF